MAFYNYHNFLKGRAVMLLGFLFFPFFFIAFIVIFIIAVVHIISVNKEYSSLRSEMDYLPHCMNDQEVRKFLIMIQGIKSSHFSNQPFNNPPFFNSLRYVYTVTINSPQINPQLKMALSQLLKSKGVYLGNKKNESSEEKARESGMKGERNVQYALQWLDKGQGKYKVLHNLRIPSSIDPQEIDSLVIGPNGIIHIETKNYGGESGGRIRIDQSGTWHLEKYGYNAYGPNNDIIDNPKMQLNRHDIVVNEFLQKNFPENHFNVWGLVVLSNKKTELFGKENAGYPVIKLDDLFDEIYRFNFQETVSPSLRNEIYEKLAGHANQKRERQY